jgi:uncharacterized membrane protein SpoIIM required for sporulation
MQSRLPMVDQFILLRRDAWARLESLLTGGGDADTATRLEELGWRYRDATADLAIARRDFPAEPVARYLNYLVERANRRMYGRRMRALASVGHFYRAEFPRLFRRTSRYTLAAFGIVFVGFILAYVATFVRPSLAESFVPGGSGVIDTIKQGHTWFDTPPAERPFVSSFIMTNNIRVTLLCFAGGVLAGIPTVLVLLQNGLQIGSIAGLTHVYGIQDALWSFVAAHGFLELSVIFISGGAGLQVAHAIIRPGLRSRRVAIAEAGRSAALLACGCVPLLIVAGTLEGFVSPSGLSGSVKLTIGLVTGVMLYTYLWFGGRESMLAARYGQI